MTKKRMKKQTKKRIKNRKYSCHSRIQKNKRKGGGKISKRIHDWYCTHINSRGKSCKTTKVPSDSTNIELMEQQKTTSLPPQSIDEFINHFNSYMEENKDNITQDKIEEFKHQIKIDLALFRFKFFHGYEITDKDHDDIKKLVEINNKIDHFYNR